MLGLFAAYVLFADAGAETPALALVLIFCALSAVACFAFKMSFRRCAAVFFAAMALGTLYSWAFTLQTAARLEGLSGTEIEISGTLFDMSPGDTSTLFIDGEADGIGGKFVLFASGFSGNIGDKVRVRAAVSALQKSAFFDEKSYYYPKGIYLRGRVIEIISVEPGRKSIISLIESYSREVSQNIRISLPDDRGGLLASMVTGDRSAVPDKLDLEMNRSGIGHISAVSGLHTGIIAAAIMMILDKIRANKLVSMLICEMAVAAFVVFSGGRVSAIRAAIMFSMLIFAKAVRRQTDPLNTICVAALIINVFSPYSVADTSFQMSFAGVFGVAVMVPNLIKEFNIRSAPVKAAAASACACIATAPFSALYFNEISLAAPLVNIIAIPICSISLILGMLYAVTACKFTILIKAAGAVLSPVLKLSGAVSKIHGTYLPIHGTAPAVCITCTLIIILTLYILTKNRRITSKITACGFAILLFTFGIFAINRADDVRLFVANDGKDSAVLLSRNSELIMLDITGSCPEAYEQLAEQLGASSTTVLLLDNPNSAFSSYMACPAKPNLVIMTEDSPIYNTDVRTYTAPPGSTVTTSWLEIVPGEDITTIKLTDSNINLIIEHNSPCPQSTLGDTVQISLLKGVTLINDGKIKAYSGDYLGEIHLK